MVCWLQPVGMLPYTLMYSYSAGWESESKRQKQEKIMARDKGKLIRKKANKTKENKTPKWSLPTSH